MWATCFAAWISGATLFYGIAVKAVGLAIVGAGASLAMLVAVGLLANAAKDDENALRLIAAAKGHERKSKPRS